MAEKEVEKKEEETKEEKEVVAQADFMYKDYDIKWLKGLGDEHPEFHLVAEYEAEYGEIK